MNVLPERFIDRLVLYLCILYIFTAISTSISLYLSFLLETELLRKHFLAVSSATAFISVVHLVVPHRWCAVWLRSKQFIVLQALQFAITDSIRDCWLQRHGPQQVSTYLLHLLFAFQVAVQVFVIRSLELLLRQLWNWPLFPTTLRAQQDHYWRSASFKVSLFSVQSFCWPGLLCVSPSFFFFFLLWGSSRSKQNLNQKFSLFLWLLWTSKDKLTDRRLPFSFF